MNTNELRQLFLDYFAAKSHQILPSSSIIPAGDPTLLFVNAGMVQFKDTFLGIEKRPYSRATTAQKCIRISGKHNDLENVGRTARHHTFFEMLGNFSFGDYFKAEAIEFAWEFLTEVAKLPKDRLWVTIFEQDDQAEELWRSNTDMNPDRILRCGEKDNFWAMGETGPCGPCSEIHYYLGDDLSAQTEELFRKDDGTFIEIWNLVFMQFNRDAAGTLVPLPKPSVDTGMGLERIASVMQAVRSNYDTDGLREIISFVENKSGLKYDGSDYRERDVETDKQYEHDIAFRVIADHSRAAVFLIAEGVNPSSDGRGYVLRRLIRRACRHGRNLGFREPFLGQTGSVVLRVMANAYPELKRDAARIESVIFAEEQRFLKTLESGLKELDKEFARLGQQGGRIVSGFIAFTLHDTYGFPLDLTQDISRARGLSVDENGFHFEMDRQRKRSRSARGAQNDSLLVKVSSPSACQFVGYEQTVYESKVQGLFSEAGETELAKEGQQVALIASETPFYAESGGQLADSGRISTANAVLEVLDVQKPFSDTIVHLCRVLEGEISVADSIRLEVDTYRRDAIRRHHSATHLLHYALREVLGAHVHQAGSQVAEDALRFDFTHDAALDQALIRDIEQLANQQVLSNVPVEIEIMALDRAKKLGAMALFGEKYGDEVRVVRIGEHSLELCGGTHVSRAGDIGAVIISGTSAVQAGVRRLEARAGSAAIRHFVSQRELIGKIASGLRVGTNEVESRVLRLQDRVHDVERELTQLKQQLQQAKGGSLVDNAVALDGGGQLLVAMLEDSEPKQLREAADDLRNRLGSACVALGSEYQGKGSLLVALTPDLTSRFNAGQIVKAICEEIGGRGGGKADLAQSGGVDPLKLRSALDRFKEFLK